MADENVIIEENEQNVGEYDPNPYDNVTVEEALKQLFNRFTPRTVRQAIFTMAENNKPATLIEKSITANGTYKAEDDSASGYSSVTVDVAGGGGETFEVEMTFTAESVESQTGTAAISKTLAEAIDAIDSGKNLVFTVNVTIGEETATLPVLGYKKFTDGNDFIVIAAARLNGNGVYTLLWLGDSNIANVKMQGFSGFAIFPQE